MGDHYCCKKCGQRYDECVCHTVSKQEKVNSPNHYNIGNIETIDYLESLQIAEDFCTGNAIKYLSRYKHKDAPLEDVKKAQWYVNRLVAILEEKHNTK